MSAVPRKWTRAILRRALEDEKLFEELRREAPEGMAEEEIRRRIRFLLIWQQRTPGEPYFCSYCGRPTMDGLNGGEVIYHPGRRDDLCYRAVCRLCSTGKERSDAGWES